MGSNSESAMQNFQRRTMIVLLVTQIVGTIGVGAAPLLGILLASEVTQNEAWAGLARTASTLGAALLGIPLGNLAARKGRRVALSSGWLIGAIGSAILVPAAQFSLTVPPFAGLLLIGSGSAVSLQSRFAATDLASPQRKGRSLSLVVWVGTIGSVLGPNLGVPGRVVGTHTGLTVYASAFLIAAACLGLASLLIFVLLRPDPLLTARAGTAAAEQPRPKHRIRVLTSGLRTSTRQRQGMLAILTAQAIMVAIMTMTPVHVVHHGGTIELVGITISMHILGMYLLAPVAGWMVDRFGYHAPMFVGIAILTASLLIGAIYPDYMPAIVASLILLGLGWSFMNVAGSALFATAVEPDLRASAQGGVDAMANLSGAIAAFIAGPLLAVSSFAALCLIALAVLVPVTVSLVRRRR